MEIQIEKEYKQIEIRNKDGIIAYAKVSPEDYENVKQYKWNLSDGGYACTAINKILIRMHQFIFGKVNDDMVIDHINGQDKLNNTRSNLREASRTQNAQNSIRANNHNKSSKYLGVSKIQNANSVKWLAQCRVKYNEKYLHTRFDVELEAAKEYDKYVLLHPKLGKDSLTNKLINYEDIKHLNFEKEFFDKKKEERRLPKNIFFSNYDNKYHINVQYKNNRLGTTRKTLIEAENVLKEFYNKVDDMKEDEEEKRIDQQIIRNKDEIACIIIEKQGTKYEILVDDIYWLELKNIIWYIDDSNYAANSSKKRMHQYLMEIYRKDEKNDKNKIIDHINRNRCDNRMKNLRYTNNSSNMQNKTKAKNKSSNYLGVSFCKKNELWRATISKDLIFYHIGYFKTEDEAAEAYNEKATELYGDNACINQILEIIEID